MIRIFFLVSLLIIALPVLGQPVIEKVEGPFQAGESLSILGSGFGETPMDPSAVQGDTPLGSARVFLSNSATYPESATLAQAGLNALETGLRFELPRQSCTASGRALASGCPGNR